jgi:hypothetical protein
VALAVFYVARSLWMVRREWQACRADTKILYLLVAPPLTLAVDLLEITDRLFWSGDTRPARPVPAQQVIRIGRKPLKPREWQRSPMG